MFNSDDPKARAERDRAAMFARRRMDQPLEHNFVDAPIGFFTPAQPSNEEPQNAANTSSAAELTEENSKPSCTIL